MAIGNTDFCFVLFCFRPGKASYNHYSAMRPQFVLVTLIFVSGCSVCLHCIIPSSPSPSLHLLDGFPIFL